MQAIVCSQNGAVCLTDASYNTGMWDSVLIGSHWKTVNLHVRNHLKLLKQWKLLVIKFSCAAVNYS